MSHVKTRSFEVPRDRQWSCVPLDGDGPFVAQPGETVILVRAHSWEATFIEAMRQLMKPEPCK